MKKLGLIFACIVTFSAACLPATPKPTSPKPKVTKTTKSPTTTKAPPADAPPAADVITTVPVSSPGGFEITLRFVQSGGTVPASQKQVFKDAAERWAEVITDDVSNRALDIGKNYCRSGLPAYSDQVDDLLIDVLVAPIDGEFNVLGSAGPCILRGDSELPFYGFMVFDSADIDYYENNGTLEDLILHEMGHVIGIGTLWDRFGYLNVDNSESNDPTYDGPNAVAEWEKMSSGTLPVANTGGSGTRNSHWRESIFDTELMTGYIDSGNMPLSKVTVGSLDDLGYGVDYAAADPFNPNLMSLRSGSPDAHDSHGFEIKEEVVLPLETR